MWCLAPGVIGVALAMAIVALAPRQVAANPNGPILPFTGAPEEPISGDGATCNYPGGCHEMFAVDSGPGSFSIEAPSSYEPGMTYGIAIDLAQTGQLRWGFQMTVLDALLQPAGSFAPTDLNTQVQDFSAFTDRQYISHTEEGTAAGQPNLNTWNVQWTAPDTDVGPVTFYAAGNAADNDGSYTGNDYIYTATATVPAPEPGSLAAGVLGLSAAVALARSKDRSRSRCRPRADA